MRVPGRLSDTTMRQFSYSERPRDRMLPTHGRSRV